MKTVKAISFVLLTVYTCTTLVWKSSDNTIDIKPTPWLSPIVTPSNIFNDSETFIKANIN